MSSLVRAALCATAIAIPGTGTAQESQWIVVGEDVSQSFASSLAPSELVGPDGAAGFVVSSTSNRRSVAELGSAFDNRLQGFVHDHFHRCGGYTVHRSHEAALAEANNPFYDPAYLERRGLFPEGIDQQGSVVPALALVEPMQIVQTIQWLQAKGTRYYQSNNGKTAAESLRDQWKAYGPYRNDFSVALQDHGWMQNSVIATIRGRDFPDEVVVIGAHLDSINASNVSDAPGADDDASGVAVLSEVLRVMLASEFAPRRTIQFMAYAAEEVGLLGSGAIAHDYAADPSKKVVAALQMDMTGFSGSPRDLYFVTDYVSLDLTEYLKRLVAAYNGPGPHQISFGETKCGYGCSDHASWTSVGVPAAFPFEALFADYNTAIHSPGDLLSAIDSTGAKQAKFVKLGLEFAMEVAKNATTPPVTIGFADILWQHREGQVHYWPIVNAQRQGGVDVYVPVSGDWDLRGEGDVDGDGTDDVVWQHREGQVHYWPMKNGQRQGGIDVFTPVSRDWYLRGVGDVDGDNTDDIIWQNSNGQVHYWPMQNGQRQGGVDIFTPVSGDWYLRGVGDVDGDDTDDIVWQHRNGQVHYWPMQNGQRQGGVDIFTPVSGDWDLRGVGDVDGDGTEDIVWEHRGGQVHYWPMHGGQRQGGINIFTPVSGDWYLAGVGNVD